MGGFTGGLSSVGMARARAAIGVLLDPSFMLTAEKPNLDLRYRLTGPGFLLDTEPMHVALPPTRQARFLTASNYLRATHLSAIARDISRVVGQPLSCQLSEGLVTAPSNTLEERHRRCLPPTLLNSYFLKILPLTKMLFKLSKKSTWRT